MDSQKTATELLPPGKVRTSSGEIIDRADCCFTLQQHKENKSIMIALDGTVYKRNSKGALQRLTPKKKKRGK